EAGLTLININISANIAKTIYIIFIKVGLNKLAIIAPKVLPIIIPPPMFITSLGENSAFFLAFNDPLSVLKNTWLEVKPDEMNAPEPGAPNNGGSKRMAGYIIIAPPIPTKPEINPPNTPINNITIMFIISIIYFLPIN